MSSMRNAVQRRNHKERAQPREREKWGVLEKHKDYSLRAADYNAKKARLKALRQKAADRNPDEFSFNMYSSKTHDRGQKLADRGNQALSQDAVKLLKTQDAGYLKVLAQQTRRARQKLEESFMIGIGDGIRAGGQDFKASGTGKVAFVESKEEQRQSVSVKKNGGEALHDNNDELLDENYELGAMDLSKGHVKSRRAIEVEAHARRAANIQRKKRRRNEESRASRLKAMQTREIELMAADRELELQRAKMVNSIGGTNKAGVKWKIRERKR